MLSHFFPEYLIKFIYKYSSIPSTNKIPMNLYFWFILNYKIAKTKIFHYKHHMMAKERYIKARDIVVFFNRFLS
jgi:hypothetical protein